VNTVSAENAVLEQIACDVSARMREVAIPDSHFHLDFTQFIPGFVGSETAATRLSAHPLYREARSIFVTPDNGLIPLRRMLLEDGKDLVLPSYGLHRGFILIEAARIPKGQALFASWLDGMDHFGTAVTLGELRHRGKFDLVLTGASAVTTTGLRFGMGARYLDIEWAVFALNDLVTPQTPVVAVVHDLQVVQVAARVVGSDVLADIIVTPTRLLECPPSSRPLSLDWSIVTPELAASPPLRELRT
jgi:5-formyltetrahydrofolate cyclo-ligase